MAADERNFRSAYYEKCGFKSIEEKRSLEILLKEKTLDYEKLRQFSLRYCVPNTYRNLIWKVLLGVLPVQTDIHGFIMDQRRQEYSDLIHALRVMRIIDANTPKAQVFLAVWLLQSGKLRYDNCNFLSKGFVDIVQFLMQIYDDDTDIYWIGKAFYDNILKFETDFSKLVELCSSLLEKEEVALFKHLQKIGGIESLPILNWFDCCFANLLPDSVLGKIWDKICGGSCKILVYVVVNMLINLKFSIMMCQNMNEVLKLIKNMPEDSADLITNNAIYLWQQHGSYLTVHDKPKP